MSGRDIKSHCNESNKVFLSVWRVARRGGKKLLSTILSTSILFIILSKFFFSFWSRRHKVYLFISSRARRKYMTQGVRFIISIVWSNTLRLVVRKFQTLSKILKMHRREVVYGILSHSETFRLTISDTFWHIKNFFLGIRAFNSVGVDVWRKKLISCCCWNSFFSSRW